MTRTPPARFLRVLLRGGFYALPENRLCRVIRLASEFRSLKVPSAFHGVVDGVRNRVTMIDLRAQLPARARAVEFTGAIVVMHAQSANDGPVREIGLMVDDADSAVAPAAVTTVLRYHNPPWVVGTVDFCGMPCWLIDVDRIEVDAGPPA